MTASTGATVLRLKRGQVVEVVPEGASRTIVVTRGKRYRIKTPGGRVVGRRVWGGRGNPLQLRPQAGSVARIAQWGHSAGRGFLQLKIVGPARAHLTAVVGAEEYLYGLGEVPSSWPQAVLRAQAIAGRSYAYNRVAGGRAGCACDILGDPRDQAYVGWDKEVGTDGAQWVGAVDATARRVAIHSGGIISTLYSSSSGGYTENNENVWGGSPVPYLRGVCDPGDYVPANPNRTWSVSFRPRPLAAKLGKPNGMVRVTGFSPGERGVSGRVVRITVNGRRAGGAPTSWTTSGWDVRQRLGLNDTRFWINRDRNVTGDIRRTYDNLNCRPGLATSNQRKIAGGRFQKFEKGRLYFHADQSTVTWVRGPILAKYVALNAHRGFLGPPFDWGAEAGGKRARFDGGEIYRKGGVGTFEVHGPVLTEYLSLDGARGDLGFPTSDVVTLEDGSLRSTFEGGTITCAPGGGCAVEYV